MKKPNLARVIVITVLSLLPATLLFADECKDSSQKIGETSCGGNTGSNNAAALFSYDGKSYHLEDLRPAERQSLYELELKHFGERKLILDNALWQLHLANEAERQQKDQNQMAMELLQIRQPDEKALRAFYESNKAQIPAPYEQIKTQLSGYLMQQQMVRSRSQLIAALQQQDRYRVLATRPLPPIVIIDTEGYPSKGSKLAPVEVVEFADYQCPHCKTASAVMARLGEKYGDRLRVVFMDFPINRSGISTRVAEGGVCADQQYSFWKYHEAAFAIQTQLSNDSPADLAKRIGLNSDQFSACMNAGAGVDKVAKSKAEALRLGLDSTPAFFVNGRRITVQHDFENELVEAIELAMQEAGS